MSALICWFQFGVTVWTFITCLYFLLMILQVKKLCLFVFSVVGGGFFRWWLSSSFHFGVTSYYTSHYLLFFFYSLELIWSYCCRAQPTSFVFFLLLVFLPPCLIFSCASESQPSLRETGDLRAQGEVACPSFFYKRIGFSLSTSAVSNPLCLVSPGTFECVWKLCLVFELCFLSVAAWCFYFILFIFCMALYSCAALVSMAYLYSLTTYKMFPILSQTKPAVNTAWMCLSPVYITFTVTEFVLKITTETVFWRYFQNQQRLLLTIWMNKMFVPLLSETMF